MVWTWKNESTDFKGKVNRKEALDKALTGESKATKWEVVKSSMVSTVYYAAIRRTEKDTGVSKVFGVVALTSVDNNEYWNFGYKDMTEDMGPCNYDCPISILKLLSETEDQWSLEWRQACYERHEDKRKIARLDRSFKVGDQIRTKLWDGKERILKLSNYQGRNVWVDWQAYVKYRKKDVYRYPFEYVSKEEH